MNSNQLQKITKYVADNIGDFHSTRIERIKDIKLDTILRRVNPYLCKVRNVEDAHDFVEILLNAFTAQGGRTSFGDFLEGLAVFIGDELYHGVKSSATGVDLEFKRSGTRYLVSIKSGPNWGNSSQHKKLKEDLAKAKKVVRQNKSSQNVITVLGCCYGRGTTSKDADEFYCGQAFWDFLSGDSRLYLDIIEPLGHDAKKYNDAFESEYRALVNKLTVEFTTRFCVDGKIDWEKVVMFISEQKKR